MSLTSSLYAGISGLATHGNSMQIVGDNIANVNTVGFKASDYIFQDLLSQEIATQSGTSQIGRGVAIGDIVGDFEQGSFESTGNTTDLAIGGTGFFVLREPNSDSSFYSRAGNFRFDKDGYLVNPEGYILQGWQLDEDGNNTGSVSDILLASFTSPPDASDHITLISNLDSDALSKHAWLPNAWDATNTTPISPSNYEYQTTLKVFDTLGSAHDITTYYDKISGSNWEYIITCNPAEDQRRFLTANDPSAGLLARGTIVFSESSGTIVTNGLTMENLTTTGGHSQEILNTTVSGPGTLAAGDVTITVNDYDELTTAGTVALEWNAGYLNGENYSGASGFVAGNTTIAVTNTPDITDTNAGFRLNRTAGGLWTVQQNTAVGYTSARIIPLPLNMTVSGVAGSTNDTYTFTVASGGGGAVGTDTLVVNWNNTTGGSGTFSIPATGPLNPTVDGTMTLNFASGDLSAGNAFVVTTDNAGVGTLSSIPTDNGFSVDLNSDNTSDITVGFTAPVTGAGWVEFDLNTGNWDVTSSPLAYTGIGPALPYNVGGTATGLNIDLDGDLSNDITIGLATAAQDTDTISFDITASTSWTPNTATNTDGYYEFMSDFIGAATSTALPNGTEMQIEFDVGVRYDGTGFVRDSMTTTQFATASTTTFQSSTGYGAGDLQNVDVDGDGIITGIYSNGQLLPLNRVALAKFLNVQELYKEGGNLYRETRDSGDAITNRPGTNGLGSISPNSLEQSNVDIASEFVNMIKIQRGFQANSKIVTVVDEMLNTVIGMKR